MIPVNPTGLLKPLEAALICGVSVSTIYKWVRDSKLDYFLTSDGIRIPDLSLERLIAAELVSAVGADTLIETTEATI
jgi:hypothetical protein